MPVIETLEIYYQALASKNLEVVAESYDVSTKI